MLVEPLRGDKITIKPAISHVDLVYLDDVAEYCTNEVGAFSRSGGQQIAVQGS